MRHSDFAPGEAPPLMVEAKSDIEESLCIYRAGLAATLMGAAEAGFVENAKEVLGVGTQEPTPPIRMVLLLTGPEEEAKQLRKMRYRLRERARFRRYYKRMAEQRRAKQQQYYWANKDRIMANQRKRRAAK